MEVIKTIYFGIIEIVIAIIFVTAFTPLLNEIGAGGFIPLLWIIIISGGIAIFVKIFKEFS